MKIKLKEKKEYINYRIKKAKNNSYIMPPFGYKEYFKFLYNTSDKKYLLKRMEKEKLTFKELFEDIKKRDKEFEDRKKEWDKLFYGLNKLE